MISIITATFNSEKFILGLLCSLKSQSVNTFEWIVVDGGSSDNTVDVIKSHDCDFRVTVISEPDFGIYDALNKGIKLSFYDYYLVVGSDDILSLDCIERFISELDDDYDFLTASVLHAGKILNKKKSTFFDGAWSFVSAHSVGTLIKKSLHDDYGFYSRYFPVAADQYFIRKVCHSGAHVKTVDFIAGEFFEGGLSTTNLLGHISETFRVQYEFEKRKVFLIFIYILRLIKNKFLGKI